MPNVSCRTFATGARQLVVQEALETTLCFAGSYVLSFTPRTKVASGPSAGAEMMTFFTGARRCFFASAPLVKRPVDSTTMSAPTEAQSISAGSFVLKTLKLFPSTEMVSSVCVTVCGKLPRTESYFRRCASVLASVTSLSSSAVRMMLRPMRPKPLMPTLMGITSSDEGARNCGSEGASDSRSRTRNAMGCVDKSQRGQNWAAIMVGDEGVGTCIGFALAIRFRTRRGRPFDSPLDFSSCARAYLLLRVFLAGFSNSWIDRAARNSSRERISASLIRTIRPCELLVRADAAVAFERVTRAHGALLGRHDRFSASGIEFLAARHAGDLFCVLPLVCECRTGLLRLPVRWDAAGSGIHCDVSCAGRISPGLGRR